MKHCPKCGETTRAVTPEGDNRVRDVCTSCETVHYSNPKIVTGCLPVWTDGRILLCRRSIEPRFGLWTLPSGFMENDESLEEGALRETQEEARVECRITRLFSVFSLPHVNQVYFLFLARMKDLSFGPTPESSEVELFHLGDVPWDELAFRPVEFALREFERDPEDPVVRSASYRRGPGDPWILGANGSSEGS